MTWTWMATSFLAGRVLLGGYFAFAGFNHFANTGMFAAGAEAAGVPFPTLSVLGTGALLFLGGASILLGAWPRIGVAMIILFLVGVTPVMHAFWAAPPDQATLQLTFFLRNIAYLGAMLALLSLPVPWPLSVQRGTSRRWRAHARA